MRRLNPDTNAPFKKGDKRPSSDKQDKKTFSRYRLTRLKKDGFFEEEWQSKEAKESYLERKKKANKKSREKLRMASKENPFPKRLNPLTHKPFRLGDFFEEKFFVSYVKENNFSTGFLTERWTNKEGFHSLKVRNALRNAKKRASKQGVLFDLDFEQVFNIFPKESKCPVLGITMHWGGRRNDSPSIDRIVPSKGYVADNVVWISFRANRLKSNASLDELSNLAKFYSDK